MKAGAKIVEKPPSPLAERFKRDIEKAKAEGTDLSTLVLKLTLGDGAKLKRDPNISTADVSFANGEMRYLGVKVIEGGAATSVLAVQE